MAAAYPLSRSNAPQNSISRVCREPRPLPTPKGQARTRRHGSEASIVVAVPRISLAIACLECRPTPSVLSAVPEPTAQAAGEAQARQEEESESRTAPCRHSVSVDTARGSDVPGAGHPGRLSSIRCLRLVLNSPSPSNPAKGLEIPRAGSLNPSQLARPERFWQIQLVSDRPVEPLFYSTYWVRQSTG